VPDASGLPLPRALHLVRHDTITPVTIAYFHGTYLPDYCALRSDEVRIQDDSKSPA